MLRRLALFSVAVTVLHLFHLAAPAASVPLLNHQETMEDVDTFPSTSAPSDKYQEEVYEYVTTTALPGLSTNTSSSTVATIAPYTTNPSTFGTSTVSGCVCPPLPEASEVTVAPGTMTSTLPTAAQEGSGGTSSMTTTTASLASTEGEGGSVGVIATTAAVTTAGLDSVTAAMPSATMTFTTTAPLGDDSEVQFGARISSPPLECSCPTNGTVLLQVNAGSGEIFADGEQGAVVNDTSATDALNQFWMPTDVAIVNNEGMDLALEGKAYFLRSHVSGKSFQYSLFGLMPSTVYILRLGFAETWQATCDIGAGSRIFDVNVNNVLALEGLDVYSETQECNYGLVKEIPALTSAEGALVVDFFALFGEAFVSAIQVVAESNIQNETGMTTPATTAAPNTEPVVTETTLQMSTLAPM